MEKTFDGLGPGLLMPVVGDGAVSMWLVEYLGDFVLKAGLAGLGGG